MAQGDDRIGPEMLNKLVAQASGRGSGNPLLDAQAGALPSVTDPAAVVEPFDEVTWWQSPPGRYRRRTSGPRARSNRCVQLGRSCPRSRRCWSARRVVRCGHCCWRASDSRSFCRRRGRRCIRSGCWSRGCSTRTCPLSRGERARGRPADGITPVKHETLPALRRWWQLPGGTVVPWPAKVSYSSLQPLLFNPYQWLLRYPARLQASALLNMPNDFRLLGQLAHRAVERLYGHAGSLGWTTEQVAHWFDENLDAIVDEEGAVLRMPGKRSELEGFRLRFRASLLRLHAHLQRPRRSSRSNPRRSSRRRPHSACCTAAPTYCCRLAAAARR
jgi:hypothetical protein